MARMHTRKKGKSKSRKIFSANTAEAQIDEKEIRKLVKEYAKQGMHHAMIGQVLKEKHGVPYVKSATGKRLKEILAAVDEKAEMPQDFMDLLKRAVGLRNHLKANHNDVHNKTRLNRVEAKIWRLSKYYKRVGELPSDWKYEPDKVALLIKSD